MYELTKDSYEIDGVLYEGYQTITKSGKVVFIYKMKSNQHEGSQVWGNPWCLYSITDQKDLFLGYKTRKDLLNDLWMY